MQLNERHNHVVSGGSIGEKSQFSIAMNAKMFRVLSDQMYRNKIGSMVRELSCNAVDAHIDGDRPTLPFSLHMPDSIEPWFAVKDEGIGMSDTDLRKMYTTYGESTKDQSNKMIGAFGLGSKTPFAYTDQFTVTSIHEGVKRIYTAVLGDDGKPEMVLNAETPTEEHAGLEVNVGVRDADFDKFRREVAEQLRFLAIKPELLNNRSGVEFADLYDAEKIDFQNDGITVYKKGSGYRSETIVDGIWIVQGGVGYPLSISELGDKVNSDSAKFAEAIKRKGAVIEFPIGSIEVTASREGISYTDETIDSIAKRLSDIAELIRAEAIAEIRAEDSVWNRVVIFNNLLDVTQHAVKQSDDFEKLFRGVNTGGGNKFSLDVSRLENIGFKAVYMRRFERSRGYSSTPSDRLVRKTVTNDGDRYNGNVQLYPQAGIQIFVRDTNSKPVARIKLLCEQQDFPPILMLESGNAKDITPQDIGKLSVALGIHKRHIRLLSTLPAPVVQRGQYSGDRRPRGYRMDRTDDTGCSKEWEDIYEDLNDIDPAVVFQMDRHDLNWSENGRLVMDYYKAGKLDMDIIAVNRQTFERIKAGKIGSQLVSVEDAAKPILELIETIKPTIRALDKYRAFWQAFRSSSRGAGVLNELATRGAFKTVDVVSKRIAQLEERIEGLTYMRNYATMDIEPAREAGDKAGEARKAAIYAKYPLLKHLDTHLDIDGVNEAAEYVKLMDERG